MKSIKQIIFWGICALLLYPIDSVANVKTRIPIVSFALPLGVDNQENLITGINPGVVFVFRKQPPSYYHEIGIRPEFIYQKLRFLSSPSLQSELIGGGVELFRGRHNKVYMNLGSRLLYQKQSDDLGYQVHGGVVYILGGFMLPLGLDVSYTEVGSYQAVGCTLRFDIAFGWFAALTY